MCKDCQKCQIKQDSSMVCYLYEDNREFFKDTKQVIFCSGKVPRG